MTRGEALARLRAQVDAGKPIIGAGAGTGLSAKLAEAGGADLIIIYNSGRYRMGGRGSLAGLMPYGDANAIVVDMARAGAVVLVPHMGLTTGGAIGASTAKTLEECVPLIQAMHDAAKAVNPDVLVLCHGGPIAEPDDAAFVIERTEGVVGFFGASSMERLPTEVAMTENMRRFKSIPVKEEA
jgi:predicted TIM-barrel enzyme